MNRREFTAGIVALGLAGCTRQRNDISIGSKNFTEQLILGEILAQMVEHSARAPVERRFYLAGSYICHQALLAGRIDMYVEYTGTALAAILKEKPGSLSASQLLQRVREQYRTRFALNVMDPLGFNNSFAIVMRGEDARKFGIKTMSELASFAPQLRFGLGYEFLERADGFPGLASTYGLRFKEPPRVMDLGLLYRAIQNKQVDVVAGSNTDGMIAVLDLVVLQDDKHYFPPYDAVPIVRGDALEMHRGVAGALQHLGGVVSEEAMRKMNYAVDGEKQDAAVVAREFLLSKHLL
jgi:glycine betaine/choline ABC-type transport system substrate-binding protein